MARNSHSIGEPLFPYETQPEQPDEAARREEYRRRLAEYLKGPEFRSIEGFPIGSDEDILALSDPPFYTACPNPFLKEIIDLWQGERIQTRQKLGLPFDETRYRREPFAADVSEGKNDPIYNAHSYHTKVPHKAIMRYILHYTDPGDLVFDGFCGTGMTGLAAQLCATKVSVESLGYSVKSDGRIFDESGNRISFLGERKTILNDLSPAATFISYNFNSPANAHDVDREVRRVNNDVDKECIWMYETWHPNCEDPQRVKGIINHTIWSDVFVCPLCGNEMVFWDVAVNKEEEEVLDNWTCPQCNSRLCKSTAKADQSLVVDHSYISVFDRSTNQTVQRAKQEPVLISYTVGSKRFEKFPDTEDLALIRQIDEKDFRQWFPTTSISKDIDIWYERNYRKLGIYSVDAFFTKRNISCFSRIWEICQKAKNQRTKLQILFLLTGILGNLSKMNRWPRLRGPLAGTLYIPGIYYEINPQMAFMRRYASWADAFNSIKNRKPNLVTSQSSTTLSDIPSSSVDYIFVDPPFGSNIIYSDLSILWESWINVFTNTEREAVIHRRKKEKAISLDGYQELITRAFAEFHRILRPSRWITIEFHNTQNSVWNSIQEAILQSKFVIADVRTLDKQQGSFKQVTTSTAVKQDLVISAYKPATEFEENFQIIGGSEEGAWSFLRQHLDQLPLPNLKGVYMETQAERMPYLLYDRLVAFHLVRGLSVPFSSGDFYSGLSQKFLSRDGMYFSASQAAEYDRLRLRAEKVEQLALFVTDEHSAIQWLRQTLDQSLGGRSQTYADLQPVFLKQLHQEKYEKMPELIVMLEQNFLQNENGQWYAPDPDKQGDLDALRAKVLLHEFGDYMKVKGRLKMFRSEAVSVGFSKAWKDHDYETIVKVGERLPEDALQEDPKLKMYYDNALSRYQRGPRQEPLL